ncbi:FAD-dependent oxidoreductase [Curvibacter sp. CHRR-16]|uniref:FAD-dependent oxidoreductase n=1 Tax=Curvibacter sp. CHRR-16 TaxID=2835872 RepID=UPI001BDB1C16|nr:FAD-dependent oxidoreductase [Curvibacter sp. CHRR-16]MBT0571035.1 FAD-dependent oxidoreductase [Curvibacter sp. CHRR-16]
MHDVIVLEPANTASWLAAWQAEDARQTLPSGLLAALQELPTGIHRITIEPGLIYLTLCHMPWADALQELQCSAHEWHIPNAWLAHASAHMFKALGVLSQWGAQLHLGDAPADPAPPEWQAWMRQAGWDDSLQYTPAWKSPAPITTAQRCAVIGAGLSGAAIAQALALRGWSVTVLEQAAHLGAGASGLPAGLVVPYVSADDNPRARLTRAGVRWMLQQLRQHLPDSHQTWGHSGVQERDVHTEHSRWHSQAAWVHPQAIVRQWLETPGISLHYNASVARIERVDGAWHLWHANGDLLCHAEHVVLAHACAAAQLLQTQGDSLALPADVQERVSGMQAVHGTMSWGHHHTAAHDNWPPYPVNGHGSFISQVHYQGQTAWMAGSTFETDTQLHRPDKRIAPLAEQHRANWQRLQALLPSVASDLAEAFETGSVQHWSATRCTSQDRLPLVGALYDDMRQGLWLVSAMGARGISLSALAAEWIAAQLHHEPWPLERSLVRSMDVRRPRRKRGGRMPLTDSANKQ